MRITKHVRINKVNDIVVLSTTCPANFVSFTGSDLRIKLTKKTAKAIAKALIVYSKGV